MATGELNELYLRRRRTAYDKFIDSSFKNVAITMASMVALILVAILIVVFWGSNESMGRYGLKFLVTSSWNPVDDKYGIATAVYGTIITSLLSLLIAIPLGVGTAVFITENIVPTKIRNIIGVFVELLAAIPSVVLGLWAIFVMVPLLKPILTLLYKLFNWIPFFSSEPIGPGLGITPAILILVVMILPIITAISRDSL
ncbi:MAG: PstC family ABC transporter permease, partial [Prochlorococcus sp.]